MLKEFFIKNKFKLILITTFIFNSNYLPNSIAREQFPEIKSEYIVDSGDTLFVQFEGIDFFTNNYVVSNEGLINLPEINKFNVSGKTISQIEKELKIAFQDSLINPNILVTLVGFRPVSFYLGGEVRVPGLYQLPYKNIYDNNQSIVSEEEGIKKLPTQSRYLPPKLFDAIKEGSGFTKNADLSRVQIIRNNAESKGGGKIKGIVNILNLIETGDQNSNIVVQDGDSIFVKRSEKVIKEQLLSITRSNLSPTEINIFINGNVANRGMISMPQGSRVSDAIAAAGGKLSNSGRIEFIRFNKNGIDQRKLFNFNFRDQRQEKNPLLQEGDIVNVRLNLLGKTTVITRDIVQPFLSSYGLYSIFK